MRGLFRPIGFLHPLQLLFRRDHRKILVADRTGRLHGGHEHRRRVRVVAASAGEPLARHALPRRGLPAAEELAVVFQEGWAEAGGEPLILSPLASGAERDPRVLVLDSRPGRGQKELASVFASIVAASREKLWITVAYFAPRHRALRILGGAARRGVDVRLLLPGKTDVAIVRHAGHALYSGLLSRGVRIFEYDAAILHAKTLVADGYLSVVGSSNLDFRSLEFNAECNFLILDDATGARLEAAFENDLAHATGDPSGSVEEAGLAAPRRRPRGADPLSLALSRNLLTGPARPAARARNDQDRNRRPGHGSLGRRAHQERRHGVLARGPEDEERVASPRLLRQRHVGGAAQDEGRARPRTPGSTWRCGGRSARRARRVRTRPPAPTRSPRSSRIAARMSEEGRTCATVIAAPHIEASRRASSRALREPGEKSIPTRKRGVSATARSVSSGRTRGGAMKFLFGIVTGLLIVAGGGRIRDRERTHFRWPRRIPRATSRKPSQRLAVRRSVARRRAA